MGRNGFCHEHIGQDIGSVYYYHSKVPFVYHATYLIRSSALGQFLGPINDFLVLNRTRNFVFVWLCIEVNAVRKGPYRDRPLMTKALR